MHYQQIVYSKPKPEHSQKVNCQTFQRSSWQYKYYLDTLDVYLTYGICLKQFTHFIYRRTQSSAIESLVYSCLFDLQPGEVESLTTFIYNAF